MALAAGVELKPRSTVSGVRGRGLRRQTEGHESAICSSALFTSRSILFFVNCVQFILFSQLTFVSFVLSILCGQLCSVNFLGQFCFNQFGFQISFVLVGGVYKHRPGERAAEPWR